MKKLILLFIIITSFVNAQDKGSNARTTIETTKIGLIKKDWSNALEFEVRGGKEHIRFFPMEIIDLKHKTIIKALEVDFDTNRSIWVDVEEINEFISFLEMHVLPNLSVIDDKNKSTEYVFNSKELYCSFYSENKKKVFNIYPKDRYGLIEYNNVFGFEKEKDFNRLTELILIMKTMIK